MATADTAATTDRVGCVLAREDQCVVMRGVGWEGYTAVLDARGERSFPRMVYLDGDLYLMSPGFPHEHVKARLGRIVTVITEELDIPCTPAGSTTLRDEPKAGGVEGDETFYLANEPLIRGKTELPMSVDPPPDLAIEVVSTHASHAAVEVWRRLGVPEVWVADLPDFTILVRTADGRYEASESSASYPFLSAAEIGDWIGRPFGGSETGWIKDVRRWVREVLAPQVRDDGGGA